MALLGLHCGANFPLVAANGGYSLGVLLPIAVTASHGFDSLVVEHGLRGT